MNSQVTPFVLAGRIFSIIGMGLTAALAILLFIIPEWWWGIGFTLAFFPFLGLIIFVEKYSAEHGLIGPGPDLPAEPD
jgi:predicted membrane metal-binding protein